MSPASGYVEAAPNLAGFAVPDAGACNVCILPRLIPSACKSLLDIGLVVFLEPANPERLWSLRKKEDHVMHRPEALGAAVCACPLPDDLIEKSLRTKNGV